jgi:hypothetical protein
MGREGKLASTSEPLATLEREMSRLSPVLRDYVGLEG